MKYLILFLLVPFISHAGFSEPKLLARLMAYDAWNARDNMWCFSGEPVALKGKVYLNCMDVDGHLMGSWSNGNFEVMARAQAETLFSRPEVSFNQVTWNEFSEYSPLRSFTSNPQVRVQKITNLGPMASQPTDSFSPLTKDSFFFKNKWEDSQLWIWKNNQVTPFFNPKAAYIFSPQIGPAGEVAFKTRDVGNDESNPDRMWLYNGKEWKVILEDKDANPASPWKSFRHQLSVEGSKVLLVANDGVRDVLLLIDGNKTQILARAGVDLANFDYFTPKMRAGTIVVRGEDFQDNKVTYVKDQGKFRKLISQGDIIQADKGPAQVYYPNRHAIFYGAPGLDENGNIYLQATLSDPHDSESLLGVGLLEFTKE